MPEPTTADVLRELRAEVEKMPGLAYGEDGGGVRFVTSEFVGRYTLLAAIDARLAAQPEPSAPEGLDVERWSRVADDLYRALRSEHGHNEEHSADWPACLPVHLAMNRYREATQ